ncbi:MAG: family 20 glycosylhydrolase, partial [Muribaculaceae bacterium]|nr:family 20 glycosylhydrolase [Muribaculaceae bacterium]
VLEIELLSRFMVITLHWHLTEYQAWRFEVKAYPQLTSASSMTRFAGQYYTQDDCRRVMAAAKLHGITVIPEIDMPGHSEAFVRAMGFDMQTTQGKEVLKEVLEEVAEVFADAPYIHIGADEKAITDSSFLPTMTAKVHSLGKKAVCWNPISGVTITSQTGFDMTQMWSTAGKKIAGMPNIDCRYNYTNHFDVFADPVGIYKSSIYYVERGNPEVAGTISCPWNDRKTPTQEDIIRSNNIYVNTLASAERAWIGGGRQYIEQGGTTLPNMGPEYEEFADWERRFLFHKAHSLSGEPISYVRQTNVRWMITDPFPNGGNASMVFPPETDETSESYTYNGTVYKARMATGAGIYLRHTWGSTIPTFYGRDYSTGNTAYAYTYIYSPSQ